MADPPIDEQAARDQYPQLAWALDIPDVRNVLIFAAAAGWDSGRLQGALSQTDWWKKTAASDRLWTQLLHQDPASARQRIIEESTKLQNMARQFGLTNFGKNEAFAMTVAKIRFDWTDEQVAKEFGRHLRAYQKFTGRLPTGAADAFAERVRQRGADFLIKVNRKTAEKFAIRQIEGSVNDEYLESYFTNLAQAKYGWMADEISAGATPAEYFAPHKQRIAELLEQSPDEIDLLDERFSPVTNYRDPETGKARGMTLNEAENWARRQDGWGRTDNAREKGASLTNRILETFGKVAR